MKENKLENTPAVFIISTGRTATRFLAKYFERYDGIFSYHEIKPDLVELGVKYGHGELTDEEAWDLFYIDRIQILDSMKKENATLCIESNNRFYSLVPVILKNMKNVKIIHVVRDGRDVTRSAMNCWKTQSYEYTKRVDCTYFPDDKNFKDWKDFDIFQKVAYWWRKKDELIYKAVQGKDNCMTVKFEDIFDEENDYPGMKKIIDFVGLDKEVDTEFMKQKINITKEHWFPHWTQWDDETTKKFMLVGRESLKLYGYLDGDEMKWEDYHY